LKRKGSDGEGTAGEMLTSAAGHRLSVASVGFRAMGSRFPGFLRRMKHFYLTMKKGNQSIWVTS
jgi:hypothetical protein